MSWKRWTAVLVCSLQLPGTLLAKPADLPIDLRINYAGENPAPGQSAPASPAPAPTAPGDQPSSPAARRAVEIFERAERQQQRGEWTDARRAYEEVHLLAPISRVGQQAIQRLRGLEAPRNNLAEEQEPPLNSKRIKEAMREFLEMLRLTRPLGTAGRDREQY
jgi:hypothetical protein